MRRAAVAVVAVLPVLLAGCGKGRRAENKVKTLERTIASGLSEQLGVSVDKVDCPKGVTASAAFRCTAFFGKDQIAIAVAPDGPPEERGVRWETDGLVLRLDRLVTHVAAELEALGHPALVDCGGTLRMGAVGDVVECATRFGDGTTGTATARVRDETGDFDLTLGALPPGPRRPGTSPPPPPASPPSPPPAATDAMPAVDEGT